MKLQNKVVVRNGQIVKAELAVQFFCDQKHKEIVARCSSLNITTSGKDLLHAKAMYKEACELWIETVNEDYDARKVLENLGWKFTKMRATINKDQESFEYPLLMNNSFKLNTPSITWAN